MTLVSLICVPGPVRGWFAAHFPNTAPVCAAANRALRGGSGKEPCAVPQLPGADVGLVGTAVGYVLSAHLRDDALEQTVATNGALALGWRLPNLRPSPSSIERHTIARVRELSPATRELSGAEWAELLRLCVLLARFEQVYRATPPAVQLLLPLVVQFGRSLAALTRAVATEPTLRDLDPLGRASVESLLHLRGAEALHIGPTFAQSSPLGGADADLIADGALIELKSSARPNIVGRSEVWQMLGRVFADTDDRYGIERCSVFALRRRRSCSWTAQELIDALAGAPVQPVEFWRANFARLLAYTAQGRERRVNGVRHLRAAGSRGSGIR